MKLRREKQPRHPLVRANEALNTAEEENSPMADFEALFTPEERRSLETKFLDGVEGLEIGRPNKRQFIQGELAGLLVLDQALKVPLVPQEMRERARRICEVDIQNYIDQLVAAIGEERLNHNLLEYLGVTRRVFSELAASAALSDELVTGMLNELEGQRPGIIEEAQILFNVLILNPGQQPAIKRVAWGHGSDLIWKTDRVSEDRLLTKAVHRLLEPGTPLPAVPRHKWITHYLEINQTQDPHRMMNLSLRGYSRLAILLAPEPLVMPNGQIDLGIPKKKLVVRPELPVRPQL